MSAPCPILAVHLTSTTELGTLRLSARAVAAALGFDELDQLRIACATTIEAHRALARRGALRVEMRIEASAEPALAIAIVESAAGVNVDLGQALQNQAIAWRAGGRLESARELMDGIRSVSSEDTQVLELIKALPASAPRLAPSALAANAREQAARVVPATADLALDHDRELLTVLLRFENGRRELMALGRELEETNRGVLALNSELEEQANEMRRRSDLKSQFFSEMNHEVRTPIHAIMGIAELLLDGTIVKPLAEQEEPLTLIRSSARQLSELIDDLLDLAKSEAGKMTVRADVFSVSELFSSLRAVFRPIHHNADVVLGFEASEDVPALYTDEGKVSQILRNLISNALKFTERGHVRVTARSEGQAVILAVEDSGIGIDLARQPHLFEPFTQIESSRQKRVKGTGLGLTLSRNLAELLGGTLRVTSTRGVGSTFELVLPPACAVPNARAAAPGSPAAPRTRTVALVDDDEVARYIARRLLKDTGYRIVEAESGKEALELVHRESVDAMVLDLAMPGLDGRSVLEQLKRDPVTARIPVVVHTSSRLNDSERAALLNKAVAVVSKNPVERAESLLTALKAVLST